MTEQCEALRLADALDAHQFDEPHAAAAELRRLSAENAMLHQRHHDDNVEYTRVLAQRKPLTDEVIADLWHQEGGFHYRFARALERAHGIEK